MSDNAGFELGITENDVVKTIPANNGLIYVTNKVFAPVDYQSVYAPVLISDSTTIMSPAIKNDVDNDYNLKYHFYLRSLDSRYNLLVPTDKALADYRDPITWAIWANEQIDNREIWSFRVYMGRVVADVYAVDENGNKGELLRTLDDETGDERNQVNDRIIRKTKCSRVLERNVIPRKTKRSFSEIFSTGLRRFMSCAETGFGHHPNPVRFVASLPL